LGNLLGLWRAPSGSAILRLVFVSAAIRRPAAFRRPIRLAWGMIRTRILEARMRTFLCVVALAPTLVFAQKPSFEVVTIKPAPPPSAQGMRTGSGGGPGTNDPGHWKGDNLSLSDLVTNAYNLKRYQLSALPWMGDARFDIQAKVPAGATRDDLKLMLQGMLEERFKLEVHREKKEMSGFELAAAKNGPKLKEADPPQPPPESPPAPGGPPKIGPDGYPVLTGGTTMAMMNGRARWQNSQCTAEAIATMLAGQTGRPVTDASGLKGKYNVSLFWASDSRTGAEADDPGPSIYTAIQEQLGLKLESKKVTVEMLVVDKAEKSPTEN
jgi:uncharacterized protein (TIGR03435 family)